MPQPTPGDVHVDVLLTNLSVAYAQQAGYIADQIFPMVPVTAQSNKYRTYPRRQWFRSVAAKRAPATESAGTGWTLSTDSYFCDVWAVHHDLDDQTLANEDPDVNQETDSVNFITQQMLIRRDVEWASTYFTTGVWSTDLTGTLTPTGNEFMSWMKDDGTYDPASAPAKDVRTQAVAMQRRTGIRPNVLVLGAALETALADHPHVKEQIKYTQRTFAGDILGQLAAYFGVDRVLFASTVQDTSAETEGEDPDASTGMNYIFTDDAALLLYANPNPGLRAVSAGYIFTWTGLVGTGAYGGRVKRFRMEEIESDRFEIQSAWDMKRVAPDLGVYFANAISSVP